MFQCVAIVETLAYPFVRVRKAKVANIKDCTAAFKIYSSGTHSAKKLYYEGLSNFKLNVFSYKVDLWPKGSTTRILHQVLAAMGRRGQVWCRWSARTTARTLTGLTHATQHSCYLRRLVAAGVYKHARNSRKTRTTLYLEATTSHKVQIWHQEARSTVEDTGGLWTQPIILLVNLALAFSYPLPYL